jgi:hypothetical protein
MKTPVTKRSIRAVTFLALLISFIAVALVRYGAATFIKVPARFHTFVRLYSLRSVAIGSIRVARLAGT